MGKHNQVDIEKEKQLSDRIQLRASQIFDDMNKDVARGQIGGMTKLQIQIRYIVWTLARIEVLYGKTSSVDDTTK